MLLNTWKTKCHSARTSAAQQFMGSAVRFFLSMMTFFAVDRFGLQSCQSNIKTTESTEK